MKTELKCVVILARNVKRTAGWYKKALFLKQTSATRQIVDLENRHNLRLLVADAKLFSSGPVLQRQKLSNPMLLHIKTPDVPKLLRHIKRLGGKVLFGPSTDVDKGRTYRYGGFVDPEGNVVWVAEL